MMAYMDKEALELSLTTKISHYFSRTKQRIWKKGESSGHTQAIQEFLLDNVREIVEVSVEEIQRADVISQDKAVDSSAKRAVKNISSGAGSIRDMVDNGKISGMGTHKQLIKTCDVYKEIVYSQLSEEELA